MIILAIDPRVIDDGITIAIVGYIVVFVALVSLYLMLNYVLKLLSVKKSDIIAQSERLHLHREEVLEVLNAPEEATVPEIYAAITMGLHMYYNDTHDEEANVLTLKRVKRDYSPWSSKIYGLRKHPRNN
ncbi:MAG: OadG family protein [Bacteroidetes bacterium]|nr:OadG family protein [Bacteroidota bacterium]MBU1719499.1 OadG family protein [Bacteroidota bacterium]